MAEIVYEDTGWQDCGNASVVKYLRSLSWYGSGVTSIDIYGRMEPNSSGTLLYTSTPTYQGELLHYDVNKPFKEIRVKFKGQEGSSVIVKEAMLVIDMRRL